MNRPDDRVKTLDLLRTLPVEVDVDHVGRMVAAFPIAAGLSAILAAIKINLNSIIMTTTGTLIVGTGVYLFGHANPADVPKEARPVVHEVTTGTPVIEVPVDPAVVLDIPIERPAPRPVMKKEPELACMVLTEDSSEEVRTHADDLALEPLASQRTIPSQPSPEPAVVYRPSSGQRAFDVKGFTGVALHANLTVTIEQGDFQVAATGEPALLERLRVTVSGTTLSVLMEGSNAGHVPGKTGTVNMLVRLPHLRSLEVHGSGTVIGRRFDVTDDLQLAVHGSGDIELDELPRLGDLILRLEGSGDIVVRNATVQKRTMVDLTGSGDVRIAGSTSDLDVRIVGSGDVEAGELHASTGNVAINGSGEAHVFCTKHLDTEVSGSGRVHSSGSAGDP